MLAVPTQPGQFATEPQAFDSQLQINHHCRGGSSTDGRKPTPASTPTATAAASFTVTVQLPAPTTAAATSQPFASSLQFAACFAQVAFATVQQQQQQQQFGRFIANLLSRTSQSAPAAAAVWRPLNRE